MLTKRIISFMLIIVLTFAASGCVSEDQDTVTSEKATKATNNENLNISSSINTENGNYSITVKSVVELDTSNNLTNFPPEGMKTIGLKCVIENISFQDPDGFFDGLPFYGYVVERVHVMDSDGFILNWSYAGEDACWNKEYTMRDSIPIATKAKVALTYDVPVDCNSITVRFNQIDEYTFVISPLRK